MAVAPDNATFKVVCDHCDARLASVYCHSDGAFLCPQCDAEVHSVNKLAQRHTRVPCQSCPVWAYREAKSRGRLLDLVNTAHSLSRNVLMDIFDGGAVSWPNGAAEQGASTGAWPAATSSNVHNTASPQSEASSPAVPMGVPPSALGHTDSPICSAAQAKPPQPATQAWPGQLPQSQPQQPPLLQPQLSSVAPDVLLPTGAVEVSGMYGEHQAGTPVAAGDSLSGSAVARGLQHSLSGVQQQHSTSGALPVCASQPLPSAPVAQEQQWQLYQQQQQAAMAVDSIDIELLLDTFSQPLPELQQQRMQQQQQAVAQLPAVGVDVKLNASSLQASMPAPSPFASAAGGQPSGGAMLPGNPPSLPSSYGNASNSMLANSLTSAEPLLAIGHTRHMRHNSDASQTMSYDGQAVAQAAVMGYGAAGLARTSSALAVPLAAGTPGSMPEQQAALSSLPQQGLAALPSSLQLPGTLPGQQHTQLMPMPPQQRQQLPGMAHTVAASGMAPSPAYSMASPAALAPSPGAPADARTAPISIAAAAGRRSAVPAGMPGLDVQEALAGTVMSDPVGLCGIAPGSMGLGHEAQLNNSLSSASLAAAAGRSYDVGGAGGLTAAALSSSLSPRHNAMAHSLTAACAAGMPPEQQHPLQAQHHLPSMFGGIGSAPVFGANSLAAEAGATGGGMGAGSMAMGGSPMLPYSGGVCSMSLTRMSSDSLDGSQMSVAHLRRMSSDLGPNGEVMDRAAQLHRYKQKRMMRLRAMAEGQRKVKADSRRQQPADARPRVRGRFSKTPSSDNLLDAARLSSLSMSLGLAGGGSMTAPGVLASPSFRSIGMDRIEEEASDPMMLDTAAMAVATAPQGMAAPAAPAALTLGGDSSAAAAAAQQRQQQQAQQQLLRRAQSMGVIDDRGGLGSSSGSMGGCLVPSFASLASGGLQACGGSGLQTPPLGITDADLAAFGLDLPPACAPQASGPSMSFVKMSIDEPEGADSMGQFNVGARRMLLPTQPRLAPQQQQHPQLLLLQPQPQPVLHKPVQQPQNVVLLRQPHQLDVAGRKQQPLQPATALAAQCAQPPAATKGAAQRQHVKAEPKPQPANPPQQPGTQQGQQPPGAAGRTTSPDIAAIYGHSTFSAQQLSLLDAILHDQFRPSTNP